MDQPKLQPASTGRSRKAFVVALAVLVLGIAVVGGPGRALVLAGVALVGVGLVAVIRGHADWAWIVRRQIGWMVAAAGLIAFIVGGALTPARPDPASSQTFVAAPTTTSPSTERSPATTSAVGSTTPATETRSAAPALPPAPTMTMACPGTGSLASPQFGHNIAAAAPYTVVIDYGDGERYTNDDQHLNAIFGHTYKAAGSYTVGATLTDAAGRTVTATCAYAWTAPVAVPKSGSSGGSTSGSGSGSGDTYTNVDGNQVHVPVSAPAPPAGATARCNDGTYSFSQHRSGTCSSHGGVAAWL